MHKRFTAVLCTIALVITLSAGCGQTPAATASGHISMGEKYLLELDYEQAIVSFLLAIDIDPMNPQGYAGAAEAYVALSDMEAAIAILTLGVQATGAATLTARLTDLQARLAEALAAEAQAEAETEIPAPTEESPQAEIPATHITDDNETPGMAWVIEPTLEYDNIRFFPALGYIGYTIDYRLFFLDEESGEAISETHPTGGFRLPYSYGYHADTMTFHYDVEYEYRPEEDEILLAKSKDAVLSIYELEPSAWNVYEFKADSKYAIYYDGRFASEFIYDHIIGGNNIAFVRQSDKYAFADANGNLLTDFEFDSVSQIAGTYIAVQKGTSWGFVDLAGNEVIPFIFEDAMNIDEKMAFVKYDGKYGILDVEASGMQH